MGELFLKLLDMSLAASWLILAVVVLRLMLKKAPKWVRGILWALVAVRLICPFSFESKLSLVPEADPVTPSMVEAYVADTPNRVAAVNPEQTRPADTVQNSTFVVETPTVEAVNYLEVVAIIWLIGMAALLLYALISYLRLRSRVSAGMCLRENIWLCDGVESPFILGLFRPRIYLPSAISEEDMGHVLSHERAHLQRRDHWWKPLGFVLLAVYWFNPLIWVAYILLCRDIELACDEKVIKSPDIDRKGYSEALLNCSVRRSAITACPLAFGEVSVRGRIKSVLNYKKPAFWIIIAALVVCVVLAVCFLTNPIKPTVHDVADQNGYGISVINRNVTMTIKVPTDVLGSDIYSNEGHVYEPSEVVVYQTETTKVYLKHVRYLEQYGEKHLYFDFLFDYEILDEGMVRTLFEPNIKDGKTVSSTISGGIADKTVWDSIKTYPEGARDYGINQGVEISIAIKTDVVREAQEYIAFDLVGLTDIFYEKGPANHEDDISVLTAEEYRQYIQEKYDVYAAAERNNVDPEELTDAIIEGLKTGFFSPFSELEMIDRAVSAIGKADDLSNMTVVAALEDIGIGKEREHANVELAKAIAAQFGNVSSDYTAYYNSAIGDAIGAYEYILVRKQLNLSYGDKVPTYFLSPDRKTLVAVKQDKEGTNYAWTFVQNEAGEWIRSDFRAELCAALDAAVRAVIRNQFQYPEEAICGTSYRLLDYTSEGATRTVYALTQYGGYHLDQNGELEGVRHVRLEAKLVFTANAAGSYTNTDFMIPQDVNYEENLQKLFTADAIAAMKTVDWSGMLDECYNDALVMVEKMKNGEKVESKWGDSFSFQGLMCGEELIYPSPITFTGEENWFRCALSWTQPTTDMTLGLRAANGTEFLLLEETEGGHANLYVTDIPAGTYHLFLRNDEQDAVHPPLSAVELGIVLFDCGGTFENLNESFVDDSTRLYHAIEAAVEKHCALATPDDRAYIVTHHNYLLDKATDGETLTAYIVTMSNVYLCKLDTNQQPIQFDSVERAAVLTFSIGADGSYNLDEFRILRDDAAVQSEFPPKAAREAADSIYSMRLDDECDNKALQSCLNAANGQENVTAKAEVASIGAAMIDAVEKLLAGKLPATICKMDPEGRTHPAAGRINAWDCANAVNRCKGILAHTYQEVDDLETSDALIMLEFTVDGTDWGIIFYDGTDSVSLWNGGTEYLLQATPDHEDIFLSPLGTLMRKWYDEAEFQFLQERVDVVPNTGQSYLEAAQEFYEAFESVHLTVSSGSHYRYNEIFCRVEAAESATAHYREQGEIGEDTYAFYAYTAFVAESERALQHSMAGNTDPYEGNDPNVPKEAFEYTQCGYITLKDDGWHGTIAGTSF